MFKKVLIWYLFNKKILKKVALITSVISVTGSVVLSASLLVVQDNKQAKQEEENNYKKMVDYKQVVNNNTDEIKNTIKNTTRDELKNELLSSIKNNSFSLDTKNTIKKLENNNSDFFNELSHNDVYSLSNLPEPEINKVIDYTFSIGHGKININDLIANVESQNVDYNLITNQFLLKNGISVDNFENELLVHSLKTKAYNTKASDLGLSETEYRGLLVYSNGNVLNRLQDRSTYLLNYATVISVVAAIAWGVAAFYWSAWYMFGGNIPFAVAATVQASLLTADVGIAWADYAHNEETVNDVRRDFLSDDWERIRGGLKSGIFAGKFANSSITSSLITNEANFFKAMLLRLKNTYTKFVDRIFKSITHKTGIKWALRSTCWASPAALSVISTISLVISLSNFVINLLVW